MSFLKYKILACLIVGFWALVFFSMIYFAPEIEENAELKIREPAVAGKFYPAEKSALEKMINSYLEEVEPRGLEVRGLVVPHAGYVFSGPVAAHAFKELEGKEYKTVIVLGPTHYVRFNGASIPNVTHYKTPLGLVEISPKAKELMKEKIIVSLSGAHEKEHSVEVEIPFLQHVLKKFELIPIVTGNVEPKELAEVLDKYVDSETLVVASSDLSHYHPYEVAVNLDKPCVNSIAGLKIEEAKNCEACGKIPILTLMYLAKKRGWVGKVLDYRNSGDTAGDKSRVVGYAAIAFYEGLNESEKEFLLNLARRTLESYLTNKTKPVVDEESLSQSLKKVQGCFVTLKKHGRLRGCIGHILPQEELYKCVMDNAISAALNDPRFSPVEPEELKNIKIEISVLTVPELLVYSSPEDLLNKLKPNVDGVVIRYGWRESTYLPQVWEQLPDKKQFLSSLCLKQGSPPECWKDAEIYTYHATVFSESRE